MSITKKHRPPIFLFDSFRGWGYNDDIMTVQVQLSSQGATRWPLPSYATGTGSHSRGMERPTREGAAACGSIRSLPLDPAAVHLVVSDENLLRDPRFCVGLVKTEAANP